MQQTSDLVSHHIRAVARRTPLEKWALTPDEQGTSRTPIGRMYKRNCSTLAGDRISVYNH